MNVFEKLKQIDLSGIDNATLKERIVDAIKEYDQAKNKPMFLEIYSEVGDTWLNKYEEYQDGKKASAQKENEKKQKAEAEAKKKASRAKRPVPDAKDAKVLFEKYADDMELNLPLHESITEKERKAISSDLAMRLCKDRNCFDEDGKIPLAATQVASGWLSIANDKAIQARKLSGRKKPSEYGDQEKLKQKIIKLEEELKAKKGDKPKPKPSEPKVKQQFGTNLLKGILADVKKALSEAKKKDIDLEVIRKQIKEVEASGKAFLRSLQALAGNKVSSTLISRFEADLNEVKASFVETQQGK